MSNTISVGDLRKQLDYCKVIDVREPDEFAQGHIPSSVNIPLARFLDDLEDKKFVPPSDKKLVLCCRSGNRSGIATQACSRKGIAAMNLVGGFLAWQKLQ